MAEITGKSSVAGIGCLLIFLGLVCLMLGLLTIFSIIGPLILWPLGIWLSIAGIGASLWYECSECGTRLSGKRVKVCPGCHSELRRWVTFYGWKRR